MKYFSYLFTKTWCIYSFDVFHGGSSNEYPKHMFWGEIRKLLVFCCLKVLTQLEHFVWYQITNLPRVLKSKHKQCPYYRFAFKKNVLISG